MLFCAFIKMLCNLVPTINDWKAKEEEQQYRVQKEVNEGKELSTY